MSEPLTPLRKLIPVMAQAEAEKHDGPWWLEDVLEEFGKEVLDVVEPVLRKAAETLEREVGNRERNVDPSKDLLQILKEALGE